MSSQEQATAQELAAFHMYAVADIAWKLPAKMQELAGLNQVVEDNKNSQDPAQLEAAAEAAGNAGVAYEDLARTKQLLAFHKESQARAEQEGGAGS